MEVAPAQRQQRPCARAWPGRTRSGTYSCAPVPSPACLPGHSILAPKAARRVGAVECGGAAAAAGLMTMPSPARGGQRVAVERLAREAARSSRGPTRACDGPGWHPLASASRRSTWATAFAFVHAATVISQRGCDLDGS
jgi:hypothetical protein